MPTPGKARYVAFYSYKGGVGRTLALANCARALAADGKNVLILDLDLEAPGLEMFDAFRPNGEASTGKDGAFPSLPGFAEYLSNCRRSGPPPSLAPYVHACRGVVGDRGKVYLMPAGRPDGAAYRDVLSLDWDRFYRDEQGYSVMENLRGHIAHNIGSDEQNPIQPEYVLMDARTGLSETGGIATHQLADLVVLLFSLNRQNLEGITRVHDSLRQLPEPPKTLLVISPLPEIMETGKGTLFQERMTYVHRHLKGAANQEAPANLPYRPVLSWEERIFVDSKDDEYLGYDQPYRRLLTLILETLQAPESFLDKAIEAWRKKNQDEVRQHLQAGLALYPADKALLDAWARLVEGLRADISHLPSGASHFLGRAQELSTLDAAWNSSGKISVVQLIAPGGVGKTSLLTRWLDSLRADNWRGAERVFGWSFYSQGSGEDRQASEDGFLEAAIRFFGIKIAPAASLWDKGAALAKAVAKQKTLLILDGLEPLQYPPTNQTLSGELKPPGVKTLLQTLVAHGQPGLILITSREHLADLADRVRSEYNPDATVLALDLGNLSEIEGARMLHILGVKRAGEASIGPEDTELQAASREVSGHALTLSLLGSYLARAKGGDVRKIKEVDFAKAAQRTDRGHAFHAMRAYETWFKREGEAGAREGAALKLLGFFDRPATKANLSALVAPPAIPGLTEALLGLDQDDWQLTLSNLSAAGLAKFEPKTGGLDAHPLVREYFGAELAQKHPEAWREGHRRIYEQLKQDTPHRPDTLAGLQPLYQAVAHGCKAGLYRESCEEVYRDRILRGAGHDGFYSIRTLGVFGADLGAVAAFFVEPWRRVAPQLDERNQVWLLNEAAFRLRALGRLAEALDPMRMGAEQAAQQAAWHGAAISHGNLSQLELILGRIAEATADALHSVEHADRSGDRFLRLVARTTLADAAHQQGNREAARQSYAEAESIQAASQPEYPFLYSLQGARYCMFLLDDVDIAIKEGKSDSPILSYCAAIASRASLTLAWTRETGGALLDTALQHLILARCAIYRDLLQGEPPGEEAQQQTEAAVSGLRAAGQQDELPRGLMTRAWLRHASNDEAGAQADLEEAYQIASRGGMKLHLADIALTRARLFRDREQLQIARKLIEECGYGRRLVELQDAEAAMAQESF